MRNELNEIDKETIRAIDDYWKKHYQPPPGRSIMAVTRMKSTAHVWYVLHKLDAMGIIKLIKRHPVPAWVVDAVDARAEYGE